jgi:hypothetical protein
MLTFAQGADHGPKKAIVDSDVELSVALERFRNYESLGRAGSGETRAPVP